MSLQEMEQEDRKIMNVKVTKKLHENIRKLGTLGEDYGDVIQRLYDFYVSQSSKDQQQKKKT